MGQKIAKIDFDGTIVDHCFPRIGEAMPEAFKVMKEMKKAGWKLILWTCREDTDGDIHRQYLTEAVKFCQENGVEFDAINESIDECEFRGPGELRRKPYASVHIDDRNLGGFPGWPVVREVLLNGAGYEWTVIN